MKRRTFIGTAGSAALWTTAGCGAAARPHHGAAPAAGGITDIVTPLPHASLEARRALYRRYLFEDFLPFHYAHVVDAEHGGFMCTVDRDGTRVADTKTAWYEGRGAWTFAFLYNHLDPDPRHRETARRSAELILRSRPDEDHFWPPTLSRRGEALAPPSQRDLYGDGFIAAGLAETARAVGDDRYRTIALEILRKSVRLYDAEDFCEDDRSWLGDDAPPVTGMRTLSAWMLFLWAGLALLEDRDDPEVEALVSRSIDAVLVGHLNPAFDLVNEVRAHDLGSAGAAYDQFVPPATVNETLWMILLHAVRRRDDDLLARAARHLRRHLEFGWDRVYGGVFMNCWSVDEIRWDYHRKGLWAQVESLNALQVLVEHTDLRWAHEWHATLSAYLLDKWPGERYGVPLWLDYTDRQVTFQPHWTRADVLHYPRHLMFSLLSMERLQPAPARAWRHLAYPEGEA